VGRQFGFRVGFVYSLLFVFPVTWPWLVPWLGARLGIEPAGPSGSGDQAIAYLRVPVELSIALLVAVGWTLVDRRGRGHAKLWLLQWIILRYYLLLAMLGYGLAKVFKTQFPDISLVHLSMPLGDLSPMRLTWSFMGHSTAYSVFTGAAEVVGGLLLVSRRTTVLGALILVAVMSNVVMLNLSYDIPVKLYSMHLLVASAVLLIPDARRLVDGLILRRACPAAPPVRLFEGHRAHRIGQALKICFVVLLGVVLSNNVGGWGHTDAASPLRGVWSVERFERNAIDEPACIDADGRWRDVVFDRWGRALVRDMADTRNLYRVEIDEDGGQIVLKQPGDADPIMMHYERLADERMVLSGLLGAEEVHVELHRVPRESLLQTRGFHWVSGRPFNP
jgi:hypothetical protein